MQNTATKISALRAELAALEKTAAREHERTRKQLERFRARLGLPNMQQLLELVQSAMRINAVRGIALPRPGPYRSTAEKVRIAKRHRTKITPELIAKMKTMFKAKKTDAEIATTLGINRSTVQRHKP